MLVRVIARARTFVGVTHVAHVWVEVGAIHVSGRRSLDAGETDHEIPVGPGGEVHAHQCQAAMPASWVRRRPRRSWRAVSASERTAWCRYGGRMRYRDLPTAEVETVVEATPEEVWAVVTDITLPAVCAGELVGAEWLDGANGPALGARFAGKNESQFIGRWETICTVVDLEPGRRWVWEVGAEGADPWAQWGFEVDPSRKGAVVRQFVRIGLGWSPMVLAIEAAPEKEGRIVAGRLAEHRTAMEANLAEAKRRAEQR